MKKISKKTLNHAQKHIIPNNMGGGGNLSKQNSVI